MAPLEEFLGDDFDFLGAPARRPAGGMRKSMSLARPQRPAALQAVRDKAASLLRVPQPGVTETGPRFEPLGFATISFALATPTSVVVASTPLRPFKGKRLVIDERRVGAAGVIVTMSRMQVGAHDVLIAGGQSVPISMFGPTVEGVELVLDTAGPGVPITITLAASTAPTGTDVIVVSIGLLGLSWS